MSESRGRGGRGRGGNSSSRGGGASNGAGTGGRGAKSEEKPRREAILDLAKYVDKSIRVKFTGGREVTGILKGYDQLLNLVMDDVEELLRDPATTLLFSPAQTRTLGLTVLRGTSLVSLSPVDGSEEIENPFAGES